MRYFDYKKIAKELLRNHESGSAEGDMKFFKEFICVTAVGLIALFLVHPVHSCCGDTSGKGLVHLGYTPKYSMYAVEEVDFTGASGETRYRWNFVDQNFQYKASINFFRDCCDGSETIKTSFADNDQMSPNFKKDVEAISTYIVPALEVWHEEWVGHKH